MTPDLHELAAGLQMVRQALQLINVVDEAAKQADCRKLTTRQLRRVVRLQEQALVHVGLTVGPLLDTLERMAPALVAVAIRPTSETPRSEN